MKIQPVKDAVTKVESAIATIFTGRSFRGGIDGADSSYNGVFNP